MTYRKNIITALCVSSCVALSAHLTASAGEMAPSERHLEMSASNYMKALSEGASKETLDQLFAQWGVAQQMAIHETTPERMRDAACWYPHLVAKKKRIPNPLEVLVRECFGLDPMAALTSADYRP